jgi:hypothetical protein
MALPFLDFAARVPDPKFLDPKLLDPKPLIPRFPNL